MAYEARRAFLCFKLEQTLRQLAEVAKQVHFMVACGLKMLRAPKAGADSTLDAGDSAWGRCGCSPEYSRGETARCGDLYQASSE